MTHGADMDWLSIGRRAACRTGARRICAADFKDAAQEGAIRAWQASLRVDVRRETWEADAYIRKAARWGVYGYLRWRYASTAPEMAEGDHGADRSTPEGEAVAAETRDAIVASFVDAYATMSPMEKVAFVDTVLGARELPEGASRGAHKVRRFHIRRKLREACRVDGLDLGALAAGPT